MLLLTAMNAMGAGMQGNSTICVIDKNTERAAELCQRLEFLNYTPVIAEDPADVPEQALAAVSIRLKWP